VFPRLVDADLESDIRAAFPHVLSYDFRAQIRMEKDVREHHIGRCNKLERGISKR
jgi:hypothetical protein